MRICSWGAWRESLPNTTNTKVDCATVAQTFGTPLTKASTLAGSMAIIIGKHKEYIGLLKTNEPNIAKDKKCVNVRGARDEQHWQP